MRILVLTIVHVPLDARIHERQIGALRAAGCEVTYAAPWSACGTAPPEGLRTLDVPRAAGRRRMRAIRAAYKVLRAEAGRHDLVLLHDPELLLVSWVTRNRVPVVWDVHEDPAASLVARSWIPRVLRPLAVGLIRALERMAERRHHLLLAETAYAERFREKHPVVPNVPVVPDIAAEPGPGRAVYVGRLAAARGAALLVEVGRRLRDEIAVEVIGDAEPDVQPMLSAAASRGDIVWHGYLPNDDALARISGATAGLSLLRDLPNFRHSMPTKVLEYMACGVPVITTPLPLAAQVVADADAGLVVPFDDVDAVVAALRRLDADERARVGAGNRGRAHVMAAYSWQQEGPRFVAHLRTWAEATG